MKIPICVYTFIMCLWVPEQRIVWSTQRNPLIIICASQGFEDCSQQTYEVGKSVDLQKHPCLSVHMAART